MSEKTREELYRKIPQELHGLIELAYNLWWSWQPDARDIFKQLDRPLWHNSRHNAVEILNKLSLERFNIIKNNDKFILLLKKVLDRFNKLDSTDRSWFAKTHQNLKNKTIAYLSMEYGIHNSVKIYSGGLGILAGDHLKESSDLGLPLVAVGFLYEEGYFTQELPIDGWQKAHYKGADFQNLPITEVKDPSNQEKDLIISINFNDLIVKVKIWLMNIGSVKLFLMDTNINENPPWDRDLTCRLYGGSEELRLKQEKILGIGAVRLFKKLNITPTMYHLNEGHCGFSSIERIRDLMLEGKSFSESLNIVRKKTLFTTHTPVPAGHDIFPFNLIETYFDQIYIRDIGRENFFSLGSYEFTGKTAGFNMTALGIRTSKYVNAVSKLHGDVSYEMFKPLWEKIEQKYGPDYHPFTYVTNGTHVPSFVGENIQLLLDSLDSNWRENHDDPNYWKSLLDSKNLSDELLWTFHNKSKNEMFRMIRETSRRKIQNGDWDSRKSLLNGVLLDPKALTLGFARRFATYKRATLFFSDLERVTRLLQDDYFPIQLIFAGKAHPADDPGKKLIQDIVNHANNIDLGHRIAFIEDYSLSSSKMLVQGVDIWLNNPLRPYEASGTSGMKASCNFVPNLSILDGWWAEGYNGNNGWAINPDNKKFPDLKDQNAYDASSLYDLLENEVIPAYYDRNENNLPVKYIKIMKEAFISVLPYYSSRRMLKDYTHKLYSKAMEN